MSSDEGSSSESVDMDAWTRQPAPTTQKTQTLSEVVDLDPDSDSTPSSISPNNLPQDHNPPSNYSSSSDVEFSLPSRPRVEVHPPIFTNQEEFEFLPGHSTIYKVLKSTVTRREDNYTVRLRSGDILQLDLGQIYGWDNGPSALSAFEDRAHSPSDEEMVSTRAGPTTRKRASGFVDWKDITLDSDDEKPKSNRRRSKRVVQEVKARPKRKRRSVITSSESEAESSDKDTRYSRRIRSTKNMRERGEDDISEAELPVTQAQYSSAKEIFHPLQKDDPFRKQHCQFCDSCGEREASQRGTMVFCQGCTSVYHQTCLGPRSKRDHLVTKIDDERFVLQCKKCVGLVKMNDDLAPHLGRCQHCLDLNGTSEPFRERSTAKDEQRLRDQNNGRDPVYHVKQELIDNVDNVMFRCRECSRAWHCHHLPPRSSEPSDSDTDETLGETRFNEYSGRGGKNSGRAWMCNDCVENPPEIEGIIAWRPTRPEFFGSDYTNDMVEDDYKEYLIQWKRLSCFKATWVAGAWLYAKGPTTRRAFLRDPANQASKMTTKVAIPESWLRVDTVFDVKYSNIVSNTNQIIDKRRITEVTEVLVKYKGLPHEQIVWEVPPEVIKTEIVNPDEDGIDEDKINEIQRWNDFVLAYEDWVMRSYVNTPNPRTTKRHLDEVRKLDFQDKLARKTQPGILTGGQIMPYQLDGLNWLYYNWFTKQNAILADEMGLGKTVQIIAFIATLIDAHKCFPWLVVVPNSTCPNWRREFNKWAPTLRVVSYYGSRAAKRMTCQYQMFPDGDHKNLSAHILITSYETMAESNTRKLLKQVSWAGVVVDEGQRLKNDKSLLYESLSLMKFPFKVLLTGTPLQNNIRELFNLLQFCDRTIKAQALEEEYADLTKELVAKLHEMLRPFILRRTKAQVLTDLPPVAQIIVPVSMSALQKQLYKSILAKNPELIKAIFDRSRPLKTKDKTNLNNILIQLRKVLCHPFIYSRAIEERTLDPIKAHRQLVDASAKLRLLELMLPKLQSLGHRVLIFSQFLDCLDVMEDFLDGLKMPFLRLDGNVVSMERQRRIDAFNADTAYFAFLLSTRAGGVGINLATADTVIILDPDFNPHQDLQALSRVHRIGQTKKVLVFQLMTRDSAEEKIVQIGKKKLVLDHVLIERMDASNEDDEDVETVLRHGAKALFEDDSGERDIVYDDAGIEKLLDRSTIENPATSEDPTVESQFSFAKIWANDKGELEDNDPNAVKDDEGQTPPDASIWDNIIKERERLAREEAAAKVVELGRGRRRRTAVDYTLPDGDGQRTIRPNVNDSSDGEESYGQGSDDNNTDDDEYSGAVDNGFSSVMNSPALDAMDLNPTQPAPGLSNLARPPTMDAAPNTIRARAFKRVKVQLPATAMDGPIDPQAPTHLCIACNTRHFLGQCPLKKAGVEHCGLCGLAHYGWRRTCPHILDSDAVATLIGQIKCSTEPDALKDMALKYLGGVRGHLARDARLKEQRAVERVQRQQGQPGSYTSPYFPPNGPPSFAQQNAQNGHPTGPPHLATPPHFNPQAHHAHFAPHNPPR